MWYQLQKWYTSIPVKGVAPSVLDKKMLARKLVNMLFIDTELVRQVRHAL